MSMKSTTTNYGTIPTTTTTTTTNYGVYRHAAEEFIAKRRPWQEFFDPSVISKPDNYTDAMSRIRKNFNHFLVNYTMVILVILFLSLIYHPISMIVFLIVFVGWFFLYFFRDSPVVLFNRVFDDRSVALGLGFVTVIALVFTDVGTNVLVSLVIGFLVSGLHAAFRGSDDLFLDGDGDEGGLVSVVGGEPLRNSWTPNRG